MSFSEKMMAQGAKPHGRIGHWIGRTINRSHIKGYRKILPLIKELSPEKILDSGCGGGAMVRELCRLYPKTSVTGLDHSPEMIALASKFNRELIRTDRASFIEGSVSALPISPGTLDLVTAFETVQFWPEHDKSFAEIFRVLRKRGRFLIVNRYPPEDSHWRKRLAIKDKAEYCKLLEGTGFRIITSDTAVLKKWIVIIAEKCGG